MASENCNTSDDTIAQRRGSLPRQKAHKSYPLESRGALREILLMLLSRVTLGESEMRIDIRRAGLMAAVGVRDPQFERHATPDIQQDAQTERRLGRIGDQGALSLNIPN